MFQFIGIAYFYLLPFLFSAWIFLPVQKKRFVIRVISIMQFSLLFYSVFLVRQMIGLWQFSKLVGISQGGYRPSFISMLPILLLVVLPFFFLNRGWMNRIWSAILFWCIILFQNGWPTMIDLPIYIGIKILFYLSLLIALYALVWLYKKFPDQSV
jgi:hypothetical protein